jgi:hypothetical protein
MLNPNNSDIWGANEGFVPLKRFVKFSWRPWRAEVNGLFT